MSGSVQGSVIIGASRTHPRRDEMYSVYQEIYILFLLYKYDTESWYPETSHRTGSMVCEVLISVGT